MLERAMDARLIAAAIPFFFALIALERFLTRKRADPTYALHDSIADLSCGIGQQTLQVFFQASLFALYASVWEKHRVGTVSPRSTLGWVGLMVGVDFAFYWFHRLSHRVNLLWAIHAVHHQSEEYNFAVALRQAWLEPIAIAPFHLPLALLGFPPEMFLAGYTLNTLYQFWPHSRGIGKLGPLEWAFNTASHHRVHHAVNPEYIDKNYSGMFILFDRLFGTFRQERAEPVYGTVKPLASFNPLWAQISGFRDIVSLCRSVPRIGHKLAAPFMPPEWRPAELGGPVEIPNVHRATQLRYDVATPRRVNRYVVGWFVVVTLATTLFILAGAAPRDRLLVGAALLLMSLATIAGLTEGRSWATPLELARLALLVPSAHYLGRGTPYHAAAMWTASTLLLASTIFFPRARAGPTASGPHSTGGPDPAEIARR